MGQVLRLAGSRWFRRSLVAVVALNLVVGGATLGLQARDKAEAFSADDAVAAFRSTRPAGSSTDGSTAPPAAPSDTAFGTPSTTVAIAPGASAPVAETTSVTAAPAPPAEQEPAQPATAPAAAPAPVPAPPFPAEGVYVYDTTGFEEVDAFGGARHDYPAQTSIVHRREGCGSTETWQPLQDRRDVRQLCPAPGRHRLAHIDSTRSFFGQTQTRRLECDEAASAFVAGAEAGDVFEFRCAQEGAEATNRVEVFGTETIVVGGQSVEAVRSRATSQIGGGASGKSEVESWVHPDTGLTLKRVSRLDGSEPGPGGKISYHEEYTLVLQSLQPRR